MADPPNNAPPSNVAPQLDAITESGTNAINMFNGFNSVLGDSRDSLEAVSGALHDVGDGNLSLVSSAGKALGSIDRITNSIKSWGAELAANNGISKDHRAEMAAVVTGLIGTQEQFTKMSTVSSAGLNTLGKQWDSMISGIEGKGGLLSSAAKMLEDKLGQALPASATKSFTALKEYAKAMMTGADNTLRLQNAIVQLAAKSGNLGDIQKAAGDHLQNFNEIVAQQSAAMLDSVAATNTPYEMVQEYYGQLGTVTNALSTSVSASNKLISNSTGDTSNRVSMLSATILAAKGSGREYADVVKDLQQAFRDYGMSGEAALKFSTSMTQISKDNQMNFDDVRDALTGATTAMSRYADAGEHAASMSQGLAENMDDYTVALQKTGMTGKHAADTYKNIADQIGNMSMAQKAFLSQQTGGPGGMQGAFQIEKMLKEGDIKGVMEKVKTQMEKMSGPAVSVEEAASSPAAAARAERQRLMLTQGPLGQFAKTEQDATRILEAFKNMDKGTMKSADFKGVLGETMDAGFELQKQSNSYLQVIATNTQRAQAAADVINAGSLQKRVTAGIGEDVIAGKTQETLSGISGTAGASSGRRADTYREAQRSGAVSGSTAGVEMGRAVNAVLDVAKQAGQSIAPSGAPKPGAIGDNLSQRTTAGQRVGTASASAATRLSAEPGRGLPDYYKPNPQHAAGTSTTGGGSGQTIDVNIKGVCIECGRTMDNNSHIVSTNPAYNK